jgi:mannose-6-phosphate isomerase-like protein (cupin superfamily)
MNKIKLIIILVTVTLMSCKTETDSKKNAESSLDINFDLKRFSGHSITFYHTNRLDSIVNTLIKNDSIGIALGNGQDGTPYLLTVRPKTGYVEIHEQFDDVAIIRSGNGTFKTGHQVGKMIRSEGVEPSRNWFCDSIKDATVQKISPGDFIIIPAMTAHQYIPDSGDTLTYWTIKVKRLKKGY